MKNKLPTLLLAAALLLGLSLLLYPSFSDWWNSFHQSRAIRSYAQTVEKLDENRFSLLWEEADAYNQTLLLRDNRFVLTDAEAEHYSRLLNTEGNGIMGYVEIPSIDVVLPIYHGSEESILQVAVGHLEWSSLPVGGESTHCVLSGHRGLPSARLFTDLDKLKEGDSFSLHVLGEELTYTVREIRVVEPHETESLMIAQGEDLCTLVTCTPYGINSHRLLVQGIRGITPEKKKAVRVTSDAMAVRPVVAASVAAIPLLLLVLLFLLIPGKKHGGDRK